MTKGVLFFAENNEKIDYIKLAEVANVLVKRNLDVETAIVTTEDPPNVFNHVIKVSPSNMTQKRRFNGFGIHELLSWNNHNRTDAFNLSPFDETILMDVDFLPLTDTLNLVWGCEESILMNTDVVDLYLDPLTYRDLRLHDTNIPVYWATVLYFKKDKRAELFFRLAKQVQEFYVYYSKLFNFSAGLYRNDYVFSIAAHLMGDMQDGEVQELPYSPMLLSSDNDIIMKARKDSLEILTKKGDWHYPVHIDQDVHIMNKFDLMKVAEDIIG